METYVALLQSYQGRDKVIRTTSYACVLLTGALKGKLAQDLGVIAKQISAARTVLRLFDDVPMWTLTRLWGAGEKDTISRVCSVLGNIAIQIYFPFEKIAWAADQSIIPIESNKWWDAGTGCWAIYLVFYIIRGIRQIGILRHKRAQIAKQRKLESPERKGEQDAEFRKQMKELADTEINEYWTLLKNSGDLVMAINWLPLGGFLWSGKLSPARTAFFGTISSAVGLYLVAKQTNQRLAAQKAQASV